MQILNVLQNLWSRKNFNKVIKNISWLTVDKLFSLLVGLIIGIWFARYLGPEQYGMYNYARAIIALVLVFSNLGLCDILVREMINKPGQNYDYLGTAFFLKLAGGLFAYLIALITVYYITPGSVITRVLISIMGLQLLFNAFSVIDLWYRSKIELKNIVIARNTVLLFATLLKAYLILQEASLISFAYIIALNSIIAAITVTFIYKLSGESIIKWRFKFAVAKGLLKDSWPLIFAGLSVSVYMKIDQVMIGSMLGEVALGNYAVAVTLSEIWYFIPVIIVASAYPGIIKYKAISEELYQKRLQQLYYLMTWLAIPIAITISVSSSIIIKILFGLDYNTASSVLNIYIWGTLPFYLSVASNSYLMSENMTKISFYRSAICAIINVILNCIMIPAIGLYGAAIATLVAQSMSVIALVFFRKTQQHFCYILKSFLPWQLMGKMN